MIFGVHIIEGRVFAIGHTRPALKELHTYVVNGVAAKWRDVGIQLLNDNSAKSTLDIIEANHQKVSK